MKFTSYYLEKNKKQNIITLSSAEVLHLEKVNMKE